MLHSRHIHPRACRKLREASRYDTIHHRNLQALFGIPTPKSQSPQRYVSGAQILVSVPRDFLTLGTGGSGPAIPAQASSCPPRSGRPPSADATSRCHDRQSRFVSDTHTTTTKKKTAFNALDDTVHWKARAQLSYVERRVGLTP